MWTFFKLISLQNDWWNIESITGDAMFPTMAELGHVWGLVFLLSRLNWFHFDSKCDGDDEEE